MEEERRVLFGKYEMGRLLGKGTFAKVYYAKDITNGGESVAIKIINKEQVMKRQGMMEQIKREISIMRLVRHPNIVELKEVMATKTKIFFVMEFVRGGELFSKVVKGKLKEEVARRYFQQLISAVDFCHSRGVSHRDLKPENLLVDHNGDLKVSDFGLSALPEQLMQDGLLHTQCGTPAYVAPEVLRKKGYDGAKADIWSCGVVLYVLLAGYLPFQDENLMNMYRKIFKADFDFPVWFSPESRRLVSKLLVVDPGKRISIPAIMRTPWFRKSFSLPIGFKIDESIQSPISNNDGDGGGRCGSGGGCGGGGGGVYGGVGGGGVNGGGFGGGDGDCDGGGGGGGGEEETPPVSPKFFNAFEFISSMSSGFDLSSLFESKRKMRSMFTSRWSATEIIAKLEGIGKEMNMKVKKTKDFKVKMQGKTEGRKGQISVTAEVFEVAPEVAVVELCKSAGDTLEYDRLYEEQVRPALNDIVWSWHGDNYNNNSNNVNDCERM